MLVKQAVCFPPLEDDDVVWLRWIAQQKDKLDILFDEDTGPQETHEQTEWLQRLAHLLTVSSKQQIRKLDFQYFLDLHAEECADLNDALCAFFTALHSQLESLRFNTFVDELFLCFRSVPPMTQLRVLDLSERTCTDQGAHIAELLRKCPNLTNLKLSDCKLNDGDVAAIASVSCSSLEIFDISNNFLTSHGMKSVAAMVKCCCQIREVYLCDIEPGDDFGCTAEVLASLADKTKLERLHCADSVLVADAVRFLQSMVNVKDLSIWISGADSDIECLSDSMRGMRSLSRLDLKCKNGFSLESDRVFADVLHSLDHLAELRFDSQESSASFKYLGEYIGSSGCRLRKLHVSGGVGDDLLPLVSALRSNSSLKSLRCRSVISHEVAYVLGQALRHNRTLREFFWNDGLLPQHWAMVVEGARYSAIKSISIPAKGKMTDHMYRLLEDVANQGHLVHVGYFYASKSCSQRMGLNRRMHAAARKSTCILLAIRKFRRSALNFLQYDIVKLIAMSLFATRANDAWSNALEEQKVQKRQKM